MVKPKLIMVKEVWYCGKPNRKAIDDTFGSGVTPVGAWRKWYEFTRYVAIRFIPTAVTYNVLGGSRLQQKCKGIIFHDRYLLKVDSRQPGGKGNM